MKTLATCDQWATAVARDATLVLSVEHSHASRPLQRHLASAAPPNSGRARETHNISSLTVWRRRLRGVEFAVRAPQTSRPNPLVVDSLLVASLWSPGAVVAVERETGRHVWRRPLPPLAHDAVYFADDVLFVHDLHRLFALDPPSGKTLWIWTPPGGNEEQLHGSPVVARGRLFVGDQRSRFWCLDARSGEVLWHNELTPDAGPINSTAVVVNTLVVLTTNNGFAVAYDIRSGREAWRQRLDGPASSEVLRFKGLVAIRTFWSVYLLEPRDGRIADRAHWRGRYLRHLISTGNALVVTTQRAHGDISMEPPVVLRASLATEPGRLMIGLNEDGETFRKPCPAGLLALRWSSETGLIYESRANGLGILDPVTGERLHDLVSPGRWDSVYCGPVDVRDGIIHMLDLRGTLQALQHPLRKNIRSFKTPGADPRVE